MQLIDKYNTLINNIINRITLQIIILDAETGATLKVNEAAMEMMLDDLNYMDNLTEALSHHDVTKMGDRFSLELTSGDRVLNLEVAAHALPWEGRDAYLYTIDDVSETTQEMNLLKKFAYFDSLTNLYNRTFGMHTLKDWLEKKNNFALFFADLDKLKYINDVFGHEEGDRYIIAAGNHMRAFSGDAVVCRLGGDEFMVLVPNTSEEEVTKKAAVIAAALENDKYLENKEFSYGMSYGCVGVTSENTQEARFIIAAADMKMYEHKRSRNMERRV